MATQVTYLNRRIPRSEFAKRISSFDNKALSRVCTKWFWDNEVSHVAWGPVHGIMAGSSLYNRQWRRSTLGWYGNSNMMVM